MSDLGLGATVVVAGIAGVLSFGGIWLGAHFTERSRRAQATHDDVRAKDREHRDQLRATRADQRAAYAHYLASATEFDSRLDLYTPSPGSLGRSKSTDDAKLLAQTMAEDGQPGSPFEIEREPLLDDARLTDLKDLLISATGAASTVQIVGSPAAGEAARGLSTAQRRWLLALEQDSPSDASDALSTARPMLREAERTLRDALSLDD